jgi:hypothetical protein
VEKPIGELDFDPDKSRAFHRRSLPVVGRRGSGGKSTGKKIELIGCMVRPVPEDRVRKSRPLLWKALDGDLRLMADCQRG